MLKPGQTFAHTETIPELAQSHVINYSHTNSFSLSGGFSSASTQRRGLTTQVVESPSLEESHSLPETSLWVSVTPRLVQLTRRRFKDPHRTSWRGECSLYKRYICRTFLLRLHAGGNISAVLAGGVHRVKAACSSAQLVTGLDRRRHSDTRCL